MADNERVVIDTDMETLRSMLGEGFHTAFRKATECEQAMPIHRLIGEMPDGEWSRVIDWLVDGFEFSGLAKRVDEGEK
jgi:hypothetical protein